MKHHLQETGSALLILIGILIMVSVLGLALVSMRSTSSFTEAGTNNSNRAFYLAESGKRYADFTFSQSKAYPQTYRLSNGEEFRLAINTNGVESTGLIHQNSAFETVRRIGGLQRFGMPCWNFDNITKPGEDGCGSNDILNSIATTPDGRFGKALQCNGIAWAETPFQPVAEIGNGKPFSISFWVKPDNIAPKKEQIVLGVYDGTYRFSVGITSGDKWFWAYGNKTEATLIPADIGYWQKVTLVYTVLPTSGIMTLYVSKCNSQESAIFDYKASLAIPSLPSTITNLFVCAEHTSLTLPMASFPFSGLVDEIRIYDRVLDEVIEIIPTCGLRCTASAYYSFNGNALDNTVNGNNGTPTTPSLTTDRFGCPSKAYSFNGSGDYISVADNNFLDLTTQGTLAAWIYINNYKPFAGIIHKGDNVSFSDEAYSLKFGSTGQDIKLFLNGTDMLTISSLTIKTWYHITATWSPSGTKLYLDGNMITSTISTATVANSSGLNIGSQLPVLAGNNFINGGIDFGNCPFDGKIDDVLIYNRALSDYEIAEIYADRP